MSKHTAQSDILEQVATTFRMNGYHGTTMSIISKQTGLGRSSLYHYFENGKLEMAQRSLDSIERFIASISETTRSDQMSPQQKWEVIRAMLHKHYQGGVLGCLLAIFALEDVPDDLAEHTKTLFRRWIAATAELYQAGGVAKEQAKAFAKLDITLIQGALVLSRAQRHSAPFDDVMDYIARAISERTALH